jgi:hypothetical protein
VAVTRALVRTIGGHPVAPSGLTVLSGEDVRIEPPRSARVARAESVVRTWRLVRLAEDARAELRRVARLEEAARRARARATQGGAEGQRWRARARELDQARERRDFDASVFAGIALDAWRARREIGVDESRPLVVLGDHPDLPAWLDTGLRHHPQVVHLPDA